MLDYCKQYAARWAKVLVNKHPNSWVILDTETTGLSSSDEVVQVGAINGSGHILLDNILVQPTCPITTEASSVHGITHAKLYDKLGFDVLYPYLQGVLKDKTLVCYNAQFDLRMLEQSAMAYGIDPDFGYSQVMCAMELHAMWAGQWDEYHESFRWQKLVGGDHSALGDCFATLKVLREMGS